MLVLSACAAFYFDDPDDLAFASARIVPLVQVPDEDRTHFSNFQYPPREIIAITFSSPSDLSRRLKGWDGLRISLAPCSDWTNHNAINDAFSLYMTGGIY